MNVLLSSAGRRVALLDIFRQAQRSIGCGGRVFAADMSVYASAFHAGDDAFVVPRCTHPEFIPTILEECVRRDVRLVIPTIDTELPAYAAARADFEAAGIHVAVSSPETIRIAADKVLTHEWLVRSGLPTVRQASLQEARAASEGWPLPAIAKPRAGSSAIGVTLVRSKEELDALGDRSDYILQELAGGEEYTVDFWVDRSGVCRSAIPRKRLEVRAGEVSKAVTARRDELLETTFAVARALPEPFGVLNVQMFLDPDSGRVAIIEVNPRFGGGYPLAWEAGARYAEWLMRDLLELPIDAAPMGWRDGLVMLRYDAAVFFEERP